MNGRMAWRRRLLAAFTVVLVVLTQWIAGTARTASAGRPPTLVQSLTTETRHVVANPDGSFTLEQSATPVRVRRGDGWVPVNLTLKALPDGTIAPAASPVTLAMSGGGTGPLISLRTGDKELSLMWPGRLPAPTLTGAMATYSGVLPDVDLQVQATSTGFAQVIVVKTAQAARHPALRRIRLPVATRGLSLRHDSTGGLAVRDSAGTEVLSAAALRMWDSRTADGAAGQQGVEGPPPGAREAPLKAEATAAEVTLTPDQAMLADPATRYPVYIDPSIELRPTEWAMVSSRFPNTAYRNWGGNEGMGYCSDNADSSCVVNHVKRLFWDMPTAVIRGKQIISATFKAFETWSWSCTPSRVDLWRTGDVGGATKWNNQPAWQRFITYRTVAFGREQCGSNDQWVEFDAKPAAEDAARYNWSQVTLALKANNEGDTNSWKRFRNDAKLIVVFNSVPHQPSRLSMSNPASDCATQAAVGGEHPAPMMQAVLSDLDGGTLRPEWEWWITGGAKIGGAAPSAALGSGQTHRYTIPEAALPHGRQVSWRVRAHDGVTWGPWSAWCGLVVDREAPTSAPVISTSSFTPGTDPNPVFHDAVGHAGTFTFTTPGVSDIALYEYWWLGYENSKTTVTGSTATVTLTVPRVPSQELTHTLFVRARDAAGNASQTDGSFTFYVRAPAGPAAHWKLDESAGTAAADSSGNGHTGTVTGGVTWAPTGRADGAVTLDGTTASIATTGRVARTDQNFTVAAWVRLSRTDHFATAVSQDGAAASAFYLQYAHPENRWAISVPVTDTVNPTVLRVVSSKPPQVGVWTHLAGVYEAPARKFHLYVNGALEGTLSNVTVWASNGPLRIGRAKFNTIAVDFWPGDIDDVRVYDRMVFPLEPDVIAGTDGGIADLANRPVIDEAHWTMDAGTGTLVADSSGRGRDASLTSETAWTVDGHNGAALSLEGAPFYGSVDRARHVAGDFNGDGKDDLAVFYDHGGNHVSLWVWHASATGFDAPVKRFESTTYGTVDRSRFAAGDFNGDGKDDLGVFYDYGGGAVRWWVWYANDDGFAYPVLRWDGPVFGTGTRFVEAGDFNGDGKSDLAVFYQYSTSRVAVFTLTAGASGDGTFAPPVRRWDDPAWGSGTTYLDTGDFTGDGRADLALFYSYSASHQALWTLAASGSGDGGFALPARGWDGTTWGSGSKFLGAGDYTADGRADLAVFYDHGNGTVSLWIWEAGAIGFAAPVKRWESPTYGSAARSRFIAANVDGDERADLALFHDYTGSLIRLWTWRAVAGGIEAPAKRWESQTYATAPAVLRTDASFTVAAWVYLTKDTANAAALSQPGTTQSAFFLEFVQNGGGKHWSFSAASTDAGTASAVRTQSTGELDPVLNTWTHLTGVYDASRRQLRLYVDGQLAGSVAYSGWHASGGLQIGRGKWAGAFSGYWPGRIDEARAFTGVLSAYEIENLAAS